MYDGIIDFLVEVYSKNTPDKLKSFFPSLLKRVSLANHISSYNVGNISLETLKYPGGVINSVNDYKKNIKTAIVTDSQMLYKTLRFPISETKDFWTCFFQQLINFFAILYNLVPFQFRLDLHEDIPAQAKEGYIVFSPYMFTKTNLRIFIKQISGEPPYESNGTEWIWTLVHELLHLQIAYLKRQNLVNDETLVEWFTDKLVCCRKEFEKYLADNNFSDPSYTEARLVDKHTSIVNAYEELVEIENGKKSK